MSETLSRLQKSEKRVTGLGLTFSRSLPLSSQGAAGLLLDVSPIWGEDWRLFFFNTYLHAPATRCKRAKVEMGDNV